MYQSIVIVSEKRDHFATKIDFKLNAPSERAHSGLQNDVYKRQKTFTMLGEVGMANESTKTTQTSVRMAQHNERTRLA